MGLLFFDKRGFARTIKHLLQYINIDPGSHWAWKISFHYCRNWWFSGSNTVHFPEDIYQPFGFSTYFPNMFHISEVYAVLQLFNFQYVNVTCTYLHWLVVWNMTFIFPSCWECHQIFQRGSYTTTQMGTEGSTKCNYHPGLRNSM